MLALDTEDLTSANEILELLGTELKYVKIGPRLLYLGGKEFIFSLMKCWNVFLDVKLHDIPNTVRGAVSALAGMGIFGLTLHVAGGERMLREAVKMRDETNPEMKIFGVTVLTSIDDEEWKSLAPGSVLDAVKGTSKRLLTLVPGVRPKGVSYDDQARVMTPAEAKERGADFIVIGRPVLAAPDPLEALIGIKKEVG